MSASQAGTEFTKLGVGGLAVAGVIGAGLLKAGDAASNLGESVNAVRVTFGDAADGILDLGKHAAESMGLSNTAFNGLAVQFSAFASTIAGEGGDVVGTMKELTQRAADFGSVMNVDIPEAATIFQSALAGETEPIRKFGIDLSAAAVASYAVANGISTSAATMTESEKVQARYALLMQATAKDAGDFANTSDGLANSTRIAKAEMDNAAASIGTAVIPALTFAATAASKLAGGFTDLNEKTGGWLAKGAGIAALAIGAASAMSLVVGQALKMHDRFGALSGAFSTLKASLHDAEGGLTGMGKAVRGIGVGLGVAGAAFAIYEINAAQSAAATKDMGKAIDDVSRASDASLMAAYFDVVAKGFLASRSAAGTLDEFAKANLEGTLRVRDHIAAQIAAGDADKNLKTNLDALNTAIDKETTARKTASRQAADYKSVVDETTTATDALTTATESSGEALLQQGLAAGLTAAANERAKAFEDALKQSTDDARKAAEDLRKEWENSIARIGDYTLAVDGVAKGYEEYTKQIETTTKTLNDHKATAEEKAQALRDERDANINLAKSMDDTAVKYAVESGAVEGSDRAHQLERDELIRMKAQYPLLADQIQLYIDKLNEIPAVKNTQITTNGRGDIIGAIGAHAAGGTVDTDWQIVGERGPELAHLPRGTEVFTNAASRQMMAGATLGQGGGATAPITVNNYRRDIGVADLNHVLAMARLAS